LTGRENLTAAIIETCHAGLAPEELRDRVLPRLRRAVPFDAAFWATVDPTTLLFTDAHQEEIPADTLPYFIENEFLDEDVNKWTALAAHPRGTRTLVEATAGELEASARYRDIFRPLGFGDELRAVLRVGGACWGCLCLHRETGAPFARSDVEYVRRLAPHLAHGIRTGILVASADVGDVADAPGLVLVAPDGTVLSTTEPGDRWLEQLGDAGASATEAPVEVRALAARVQRGDPRSDELPRLRVRTRSGRWAVLHGARMPTAGPDAVAVVIQEPSPAELAPILMMAYGLTKQEQVMTGLVCRGLSTREICDRLKITANTVQDHLKSIFDKTGVSSRRELVASILQEQYLPRAMTRQPLGPSGSFRGRAPG
jgi:DNA-binding CsgD family transcriptional regulator